MFWTLEKIWTKFHVIKISKWQNNDQFNVCYKIYATATVFLQLAKFCFNFQCVFQLDEDVRVLLQRFDAETADEDENKSKYCKLCESWQKLQVIKKNMKRLQNSGK